MKAGIAGGGAVGSLFASLFNEAGMDYAVYEKDPDLARALAEGTTLSMPEGERVFRSKASSSPGILSACDIVFLFVKSYSTADAMQDIVGVIKSGAIVVSLQNGIGNREIIESFVDPARVVSGSITLGAARVDSHTVAYGGSGSAEIGGPEAGAVEAACSIMERAGVPVEIRERPEEVVWRKAVINAAINPLGALLDVPNGKLLEIPDALVLQEYVIRECALVAGALGITLDADELIETVRGVCVRTAVNTCSMLQDLRAGRQTEIDSINGAVARLGREAGIAAPYNEALTRLIRARERAAGA